MCIRDRILHYGGISSDTWSQGNGGNVVFKANNLLIDAMGNGAGAGITSEARAGSAGQGGSVVVDVTGHLQLAELGFISTATSAQGNAGPVSVMAGQLTIDGKASGLAAIDSSSLTGSTGNAGPVSYTHLSSFPMAISMRIRQAPARSRAPNRLRMAFSERQRHLSLSRIPFCTTPQAALRSRQVI